MSIAVPLLITASDKGVLITHSDNATTFLPLENEVQVSVVNSETLKFSGWGISDLELSISNVKRIEITENNINSIKQVSSHIQIRISPIGITLAGLPNNQVVSLLDIKGVVHCQSLVDVNGNTFISTERLPQGIYFLSISKGETYKIVKR